MHSSSSPDPETLLANSQQRVRVLIEQLAEAERELRALTVGQVDTLLDPVGKTHLLHQTQATLQASEERYRRLVDHIAAIVVELAPDGTVRFVNEAVTRITGYAPAELIGRNWYEIFLPGHEKRQIDAALEAFRRGEDVTHYVVELLARDGSRVTVDWSSANRYQTDGRLESILGLGTDITEQRRIEQALRESEHFARATLDGLSAHICILDATGALLAVNQAWWNFARANFAPSVDIADRVGPGANYLTVCDAAPEDADAVAVARGIHDILHGDIPTFTWEYPCHSPTEQRWFVVRITRFPDTGSVRAIIAHENITERKIAEQRSQYLANFDALTGLPNRHLLRDRLRMALRSAQRRGSATSILHMGLDRFKLVNDSLGHDIGDEFLKAVALRLATCIRETDTLARIGGDEFVIVSPDVALETHNLSLARRILEAFERPLQAGDHTFVMTCSIGISLFQKDGQDDETLLRNADLAMHRAKELGKNNCQFYTDDLNVRLRERVEMEDALRQALEREEFVLHYQPQIDLYTRNVVGMEALIRWRHPIRGLVSPAKFIPIAEETGLIIPIGAWVLREACAQNKAWQNAGLTRMRVAVNLSARQFQHAEFSRWVAAILREAGLDADYLEIELTESMLADDTETAIATLRALKELGVHLSLDDFGTGYSNLSYLQHFPIDRLKIDQSFVRGIPAAAKDVAIIDAMIAMAHSMRLQVLAEGVETEDQLEYLCFNLCDEAQGYYFSRPLPAEEAARFLWGTPVPRNSAE